MNTTFTDRIQIDLQSVLKEKKEKQQTTMNILCLPGGGCRGTLQAQILKHLEDELMKIGTSVYEYFDVVIGVSTGSIIASYIIKNRYTFEKYQKTKSQNQFLKILNLYENITKKVFCNTGFYNVSRYFKTLYSGYMYDRKYLEQAVNQELEDLSFDQLEKVLLIPSYRYHQDENGYNIVTFSNIDGNVQVRDAVLASCAAPIYFQPYEMKCRIHPPKFKDPSCSSCFKEDTYIDGGIYQNNPILLIDKYLQDNLPTFTHQTVKIFNVLNQYYNYCENDIGISNSFNHMFQSLEQVQQLWFKDQCIPTGNCLQYNSKQNLKIKYFQPIYRQLKPIEMDDSSEQKRHEMMLLGSMIYDQNSKHIQDFLEY